MGLEKDVKAGWNDLKGFLKNSKKRVSRLRNALSSSPGNLTPRGGWTTKLLVSAVLFYFGLNYAQSDFDNKKENKNKTEQTDPNYNIKKIPLSHSLYPQLVSYATDIAAIPNGNIYASSITGWVSVIDPLTNKVIGDITPENIQGMPIGFGLDDIEAESGGQFIYVANGVNNKLHKIDVNTYSVVKTFNVGKITEMARKPDQRLIYFSEESNTSIKILDVVSDSLTSKDIGFAPRDMVFNAAGDRIYVYGENRVKIMDPSLTQTYDEITVSPSFQQDMVITPDNQFMFISDKSNYLYKIDFFTNNAIGLLSDDWLYGLAVDKEGKYLYAVNQSDKTIEKIDIASSTTTKNVVETISINDAIALENITFGPFNEDLYVTDMQGNAVYAVTSDVQTEEMYFGQIKKQIELGDTEFLNKEIIVKYTPVLHSEAEIAENLLDLFLEKYSPNPILGNAIKSILSKLGLQGQFIAGIDDKEKNYEEDPFFFTIPLPLSHPDVGKQYNVKGKVIYHEEVPGRPAFYSFEPIEFSEIVIPNFYSVPDLSQNISSLVGSSVSTTGFVVSRWKDGNDSYIQLVNGSKDGSTTPVVINMGSSGEVPDIESLIKINGHVNSGTLVLPNESSVDAHIAADSYDLMFGDKSSITKDEWVEDLATRYYVIASTNNLIESINGRMSLDIPANALDNDMYISTEILDSEETSALPQINSGAVPVVYEIGPESITFNQDNLPVLKIDYSEPTNQKTCQVMGNKKIFRFDENNQTWTSLETIIQGNFALANINSSGLYAVGDESIHVSEHPWPMSGHDPRHTSMSEHVGPQGPFNNYDVLKWVFDEFSSSAIITAPVITNNGVIILMGSNGRLYFIDTEDGKLKFEKRL